MEKVSELAKVWDLVEVEVEWRAVDSGTEQKAEGRRQKAEKALRLCRRTPR